MTNGEYNCPYCDLAGPHAHDIRQQELELMRGCQRAFELELSRLVGTSPAHSHFTLQRHDHGFEGFYWSGEPRAHRNDSDAWNFRQAGTEYIRIATQREWTVWRTAWRAARATSPTRAPTDG